MRPAQGILTGPDGLARKLAPQLSRPNAPVNPGEISARLMAPDAARTVAEFARIMTAAAADAHEQRRIVNPMRRRPLSSLPSTRPRNCSHPRTQTKASVFSPSLAG